MKALVTGGGGFVGRRVVELLRERGDEVTFLARGSYPEVEASGATGLQVDLRDADALAEAVRGHDVIFHVASMTGFWERPGTGLYRAVNVEGTRNLLTAAEAAGVPRLVYTSTPSVVGYEGDVENGGQELPYAETHESEYPRTKAEAEQFVLAANGPKLATVALRPHLVFGPRDNHLLPRLVDRARAGKLPVVGDGASRMDLTYIDNVAWAHLDAADALVDCEAQCAGRPYFISNDEPVVFYDWFGGVCEALDVPRPSKTLSLGLVRTLGSVLEWTWNTFPMKGEPRITPFIASGLARHHWYDMEPAKRDLGFRVRVTMEDATAGTIQWLRDGEATVRSTDGEIIYK